jgi:CHAT domain-containing protein
MAGIFDGAATARVTAELTGQAIMQDIASRIQAVLKRISTLQIVGIVAVLLTLALIAAGVTWMGAGPSPQPTTIATGQVDWRQHYRAGEIRTAVQLLEREWRNQGAPAKRFAALFSLSGLCYRIGDGDCMLKYAAPFIKEFQAIISDKASHNSLKGQVTLALLQTQMQEAFLNGRRSRLDDILAGRNDYKNIDIQTIAMPVQAPDIYAQIHLVAARHHAARGKFKESQEEISKVLSAVAMPYAGATPTRANLAVLLSGIVDVSLENGDTLRALRLTATLGGLADKALADSTPDLAHWEMSKAEALLAVREYDAAAQALRRARALAVRIDAGGGDWLAGEAANREAIARALGGDPKAARAVLKESVYGERALAVLKAGGFDDGKDAMGVFGHALADIFLSVAAGEKADRRWLAPIQTLDVAARTPDAPPTQRRAKALRDFALGLLTLDEDRSKGAALVSGAAQGLVRNYTEKLAAAPDTFPMPDWIDRIVLESALSLYGGGPSADAGAASFVLQAADILNRSALQSAGDLATVAAASGDGPSMLAGRTIVSLNAQMRSIEDAGFQNLLSISDAVARTKPSFMAHEAWRSNYARTAIARRTTIDALAARTGFASARAALPDLAKARTLLSPDEAFVTTVALPGALTQVCLTRDALTVRAQKADGQSLTLAAKLLTLALTATHPRSATMDAQFPVDAARSLHDAIMGSIQDCLRGKKHLIYAPHPAFAAVPLHALLPTSPPKRGDGYDLGAAQWVGWRYAISVAPSLQGFMATREMGRRATFVDGYLGVGNPVLGEKNGPLEETLVATRASAKTIAGARELQPLPDTAAEIEMSARRFAAAKPVMLLGADATEERLRQEPLSEFAVIAFATHGLLSADLPGLEESALVLTPGAATEDAVDGLLTASELAQLPLRARLVILSACNSANFDANLFAPSLRGLATALAAGGVPSVLGAGWPVESEFSTAHVGRFIALAARGVPVAEAQRLALVELKGQKERAYLHPRFWAPFAIHGDGATRIDKGVDARAEAFVQQNANYGEFADASTDGAPQSNVRVIGFQMQSADGGVATEVFDVGLSSAVRLDAVAGQAPGAALGTPAQDAFFTYNFNGEKTDVYLATAPKAETAAVARRLLFSEPGSHTPLAAATSADGFLLTTASLVDPAQAVDIKVRKIAAGAQRTTSFKVDRGDRLLSGRAYHLEDGKTLFILTAGGFSPDVVGRELNDFATLRYCERPVTFSTYVFSVDADALTIAAQARLPGLRIADFDPTTQRFVGTKSPGCHRASVGVAGRLDSGLKPTIDFETPPGVDMQFDALHVDGENLNILGSAKRLLAFQEMETQTVETSGRPTQKKDMREQNQATDIVRLRVNMKSKAQQWRVVGFGGNVYLAGARYAGSRFVAVGSVGGNAAVVQVP